MDDIMAKLSEVLNDPQSMQQITQLASALSSPSAAQSAPEPQDAKPQQQSPPDLSAMLSSLFNSGADSPPQSAQSAPQSVQQQQQTPDIAKLMQIGNIISGSGVNDKNIALLMALRPLLKEENQVKIDRLVKIFRIMAAYPLIRDSGLLGGDLFG